MLNHNYMINRNTEISENGITEILENIEPDILETEISEKKLIKEYKDKDASKVLSKRLLQRQDR